MKKKMSLLLVLLVAVVLTGYSVSGTYAKYTSELSDTDTARVAKWAFDINENPADLASKSFTFDLFNTVGDTDAYAAENIEQDTAVATSATETIIAPGTSGRFAIKVANKSEVMAKVSTAFEVTNTNGIPVELSIDKNHWFNSTDFAKADKVNPTEVLNVNGETTVTVYWRWNFEARTAGAGETTLPYAQSDSDDTTLGIGGTASISVKAKLTATQIDTNETTPTTPTV